MTIEGCAADCEASREELELGKKIRSDIRLLSNMVICK